MYFILFVLIVSTSASDCLERLVSEMTYYMCQLGCFLKLVDNKRHDSNACVLINCEV